MRTFLAPLFALSLIACVGTIDSGTGDDDDPGALCGNGTIDEGETCDEGDTTPGDGCSATCQTEATPRLDLTVDKPTITTELMTTHMVTITLNASDGFAGQVTLTPNTVPGWTIALDRGVVDVPMNGTATAIATITIPSAAPLTGTFRVMASSSAGVGTFMAESAITAANQITMNVALNGNNLCDYPAEGTNDVAVGTKIRWFNTQPAGGQNVTIHITSPGGTGVSHQPDPGSAPQTAYEQTIAAGGVGNQFSWYCHAPGPNPGQVLVYNIVAAPQ